MWITFWVIVRTNQIFVYIILFWNKQELMNIPKVTIHNEVFTFGSTSSCQTSDSWHKQKSCWLSQNNTLLYTSWEIMRCRRILNYFGFIKKIFCLSFHLEFKVLRQQQCLLYKNRFVFQISTVGPVLSPHWPGQC